MLNLDDERDKLIKKLSEQYSQNIINITEYERILEYINKIETQKEIIIIGKIIQENMVEEQELSNTKINEIIIPKINERHLSMFSWRTSNVKSINGSIGNFISLFGANKIILDSLPKGKTILNVSSIFGLTEIIILNNVKIINKIAPIFSGIYIPNIINEKNEEIPELYIVGKVVFGNITVKTIDELKKEKDFEEKLIQKTIDKI